MVGLTRRLFAGGTVLLCLIGVPRPAHAQLPVGTWVRQAGANAPAGLSMTLAPCCGAGRRIVYKFGDQVLMTVDSAFDGKDAPVMADGKPTGETMAITRLDDHHASSVIKMNGKAFSTSKSTLSADGKTITVENDTTSAAAGQSVGKTTEIWVKK